MTTPILPIVRLQDVAGGSAPLDAAAVAARPAVCLQRGPFRDRPDIWSLVRGDNALPLATQKSLFDDSSDWFAAELERCATKPRFILLGSAAPRLGHDEAMPDSLDALISVIARHDIVAWLSTRATLSTELFETLTNHRDRVRVSLGAPTLDPQLMKAIDPAAAAPAEALKTISELVERGVAVEVALDPLLPGVSDSADSLRGLLEALSRVGVEQVTAGYLVLHDGDAERLRSAFDPGELPKTILSAYEDGVLHREGRYLVKSRRQRGYATLIALAAELGITVRLNAVSNPDFRPPREETPHHVRSLQESFRARVQPVRDRGALGA
jgi:DNA repair photolyase